MKNIYIVIIAVSLSSINVFSQQNVGIGTNTPNATAALEVTSPTNNQGVLVPRLTTLQRTAITTPANGLLVYDTNFDCFYYYISATSSWQSMCSNSGITGPTGPNGATGVTGSNGVAGISCWDANGDGINDPAEDTNFDGAWNSLDCAGSNGTTGAAGATGAAGVNGIACWDANSNGINDPTEDANADGFFNSLDCIAGVVGPTGAAGVAGANGATGAAGVAGTNGATGATGVAGANGATGATGVAGANGATGATGVAGANGATGATGVAGANGATGASGVAGANGATGASGVAGANGATGATGATGPTWNITSNNFNTDGSLALVTTAPSTVTSTNFAWLLGGNNTTALRQMGSIGAQPVNFITTNVERYRMQANGQISVNCLTSAGGDLFASYGSGYAGAIQSTANVNDWPINGYSTGTFAGIYGENTGTGSGVLGDAIGGVSGNGVFGGSTGTVNGANGVFGNMTTAANANGMGVRGQATAAGSVGFGVAGLNVGVGIGTYGQTTLGTGVYGYASGAGADGTAGQASSANGFGVWGINTAATGTGVIGAGNNSTSFYLVNGTGGAFNGRAIGVYARAVQDSTTNGILRAGGYFYTNASAYAYVGVVTAAGVIRKIEGTGTVNTVVKDLAEKLVVLSAPEAPENLFEDYGVGQLYNGYAHIKIDPILTKNIVVNEQHPLRVFIQLEGDCKGVYVNNKNVNGFDVRELMNGNSNVSFSWHLVANRADDILNDGSVSRYSAERFAPAIGPQAQTAKTHKILEYILPTEAPVKK